MEKRKERTGEIKREMPEKKERIKGVPFFMIKPLK